MHFRVRYGLMGSSASSTVKVQREEGGKARLGSEQCASPWGARPLGAMAGGWRLGGSERRTSFPGPAITPHSAQHPGPYRQE